MEFKNPWKCPSCGKQWHVSKHKSPMRDKDSLECDCGYEIIRWNGGVFYLAQPIKEQ